MQLDPVKILPEQSTSSNIIKIEMQYGETLSEDQAKVLPEFLLKRLWWLVDKVNECWQEELKKSENTQTKPVVTQAELFGHGGFFRDTIVSMYHKKWLKKANINHKYVMVKATDFDYLLLVPVEIMEKVSSQVEGLSRVGKSPLFKFIIQDENKNIFTIEISCFYNPDLDVPSMLYQRTVYVNGTNMGVDFTINALMVKILRTGLDKKVIDFHSGCQDIRRMILRTITDKNVAFGQALKFCDDPEINRQKSYMMNRIFRFFSLINKYRYHYGLKWNFKELNPILRACASEFDNCRDNGIMGTTIIKVLSSYYSIYFLKKLKNYDMTGIFPHFVLAFEEMILILQKINYDVLQGGFLDQHELMSLVLFPAFRIEYFKNYSKDKFIKDNVEISAKIFFQSLKINLSFIQNHIINEWEAIIANTGLADPFGSFITRRYIRQQKEILELQKQEEAYAKQEMEQKLPKKEQEAEQLKSVEKQKEPQEILSNQLARSNSNDSIKQKEQLLQEQQESEKKAKLEAEQKLLAERKKIKQLEREEKRKKRQEELESKRSSLNLNDPAIKKAKRIEMIQAINSQKKGEKKKHNTRKESKEEKYLPAIDHAANNTDAGKKSDISISNISQAKKEVNLQSSETEISNKQKEEAISNTGQSKNEINTLSSDANKSVLVNDQKKSLNGGLINIPSYKLNSEQKIWSQARPISYARSLFWTPAIKDDKNKPFFADFWTYLRPVYLVAGGGVKMLYQTNEPLRKGQVAIFTSMATSFADNLIFVIKKYLAKNQLLDQRDIQNIIKNLKEKKFKHLKQQFIDLAALYDHHNQLLLKFDNLRQRSARQEMAYWVMAATLAGLFFYRQSCYYEFSLNDFNTIFALSASFYILGIFFQFVEHFGNRSHVRKWENILANLELSEKNILKLERDIDTSIKEIALPAVATPESAAASGEANSSQMKF